MNETLPSADPGAQKRRSTRIAQAVPISVAGVDALGQPFKERTTTVMVNCHGCKYQSKHYVPKNSVVTLEIPRMEPAFPPLIVQGHVVWVQRPRTVRELFQIGLEFETAGNVWGIAFPPEDWFPAEDDKAAAGSAASSEEIDMDVEVEKHEPGPVGVSTPGSPDSSSAPEASSAPGLTATGGAGSSATSESKIHVMPSPVMSTSEAQAAIARQMAQIVAEAKESLDKTLRRGALTAINEEMTVVRQQLDAQMHETVERAMKASMERISESEVKKLVQQVANKAAAIVEEARLASEAQVAQIDTRVREAVKQATTEAAEQAANRATSQMAAAAEEMRKAAEANLQAVEERTRKASQEAVSQAAAITDEARRAAEADLRTAEENIRKTAEDAARLAANRAIQQTVSQDLRQAVEEVVQRIIAERETKVPSLQVLSSPEAAQAHLDEWKKTLTQAAEEARQRVAQESHADAEAASSKLREEIETIAARSSAKVGEKLAEVSQVTLASAEREITERGTALRMALNEVISQANVSVESFRSGLAQQRAEAERARALLHEASESAIEQTRQRIGQVATEEGQSIGHLMEELIAQRIQSIDPILTSAAENVMQRYSGEIEQKIGSKVAEARRAVSEITDAAGRANELQNHLQQRLSEAAAQAANIQDSIQSRMHQVTDAAVQKAVSEITGTQQEFERLRTELHQHVQQVSQDLAQRKSGALEYIQQASTEAVESALSRLAGASHEADRLQEAIRSQVEQASGQVALIEHAAREKVQRESDAAVQKAVSELAFVGQEVVRLQDALRAQKEQAAETADEAAQVARQKIEEVSGAMVQEALSSLQNAAAQAQQASAATEQAAGIARDKVQEVTRGTVQEALSSLQGAAAEALQAQKSIREQTQHAEGQFTELQQRLREQVRTSLEQEGHESLDRLRHEAAKLPTELEAACRGSITRMEEELDQKSSEMQHSAYEALLKTSEWYQKKAQTSMQSTMERVVEQSSNSMTEKARDISTLFASELEHYHRDFVNHGRETLDETAKEAIDRGRSKLNESVEIASATVTDRVQHLMHEALQRFQQTSHEAIEKSQTEIKRTYEGSLEEFQKRIDDKMTLGVEQATTYLQSQLIPLMESWEDKRQVEEHEWTEQLKQSADDSIASYKARLENTTNGWLLASAATLGQNSQAVLDSLSKAAEKQLRETCSRVLAGMADILKERLLGISVACTEETEERKS
ncbi:MAG TPA: hypothetical protein VG322_16875 [Candidatus Acidoferrales bacterium]|nr:hypothetical protein [Candidatus Acidoferrales bacterium]